MATQSVAGGGHAQSNLDKHQPSLQSQVPAETMAILCSNTVVANGDGRKISFVIQDDSESRTSSQTTLAMQVIQFGIIELLDLMT